MNRSISEILSIYRINASILTAPGYLNFLGIRHPEKVNMFNDELYYFWYDESEELHCTSILDGFTTDPGKYYLNNPINKDGCAILKEGFYPDLWRYGYHKGKYPALVQCGICEVYRDGNLDDTLDYNQSKVVSGLFGINLHRANPNVISKRVDKWSAGCQVIASPVEFHELMSKVEMAFKSGQVNYPYLLVSESWI